MIQNLRPNDVPRYQMTAVPAVVPTHRPLRVSLNGHHDAPPEKWWVVWTEEEDHHRGPTSLRESIEIRFPTPGIKQLRATDGMHSHCTVLAELSVHVVEPPIHAGEHDLALVRVGVDSWESFIEQHKSLVQIIVKSYFGDPSTQDDVQQEIWTKLYQQLHSYKVQPGCSFSTWLSKVVRRTCIDFLRKRKTIRERSIELTGRVEPVWGGGLSPRLAEFIDHLRTVLDPEAAVIAELKFVQRYQQTEIAEILGCSPATVSRRLQEILTRLKDSLP
jgi:RNA polymerase sigma factor (sigma-70 family)